jgi:hypothetical protein
VAVLDILNTPSILAHIPPGLREPLIQAFNSIVRNFREGRWEPSELNGGKLCETVYAILAGHVAGKFPLKPTKPRNMLDACKAFEQADASRFPRPVRVQVPRMLIALYEVRNNRGVGHVGGDVDPNHMDALLVLNMSKWIMSELVRIFHGVDTGTATNAVDALVERTLPLVWDIGENKRILDPELSMKDKALALLYRCSSPVAEADLVKWIEHSNPAVFRRDILVRLHKAKLIEYDKANRMIHISPTGARYVEDSVAFEV